MVEEFVKLNNFLMTRRRRRGVFETKRGVIFEHVMMGFTFRLKTVRCVPFNRQKKTP